MQALVSRGIARLRIVYTSNSEPNVLNAVERLRGTSKADACALQTIASDCYGRVGTTGWTCLGAGKRWDSLAKVGHSNGAIQSGLEPSGTLV